MRFGEKAEALRGFLLHPDIDFRGGVFADADEGKSGLEAARFQRRDAGDGLRVDLFSDGAAINQIGGHSHHSCTAWIVSISMTGVLGQRSSRISSPVIMTRCPLNSLTEMLVLELCR